MNSTFDPSSRTVVVTGATGRFAHVLIPRLQEAGYPVIPVHGPHRSDLAPSADTRRYRADLTIEKEVDDVFAAIGRDAGSIYALVHAVGAWATTPFSSTSAAEWEALIRTNLLSTFLSFRAASRLMTAGGRLIAFSAGQGASLGTAGQSAYGAAKAGVVRLVESVAAELADRNVTAHGVAPSLIVHDDTADQKGVRAGDLADLCLHLLSPAGKAHNGQVLRAYG